MIDVSIAESFLKKINQIYFDNSNDDNTKLLLISSDFTSLLKKIVHNLNIKSISGYSLSLFIINRYNLDDYHSSFFREFYFKVKRIKKDKNSKVKPEKLEFYYHLIISVISRIFNIEINDDTNKIVRKYADQKSQTVNKREDFYRVKIIDNRKVDNQRFILCTDEDLGEFNLILKDDWTEISNIIFPKLSVNLFKVEINTDNNELRVICDNNSYLVIEPDYLIDVTDISQHSEKNSYYHYFVKRYIKISTFSEALLVGSIVNSIFDDLLIDNNLDFMTLLEKAIKSRLLTFFVLLKENENFFSDFKNRIQNYYDNLISIINKLEKGEYSTEPSFIAPDFGIQGRLDLLIESENTTTIMELKSGRSPKINNQIEIGKRKISAGAWREHIFQIAGYNLLIEYAEGIERFNTCLIYAGDDKYPIRVSSIDKYTLLQFILMRNYLVALEFKLKAGDFKIIDNLNKLIFSQNFEEINQFARRDIKQFHSVYSNNREITKKWFLKISEFISKEIFINKYGNADANSLGSSSFWLDDERTKIQNKTILVNLKFDLLESDFETMHLVFFSDNGDDKSVFRVGDLVIIYPFSSENKNPTKNVIYKGYIKELNSNKIQVSFRNKKINKSKFLLNDRWNLEIDQSDINTKNQFSAIFELLMLTTAKQDIILGLNNQEFDDKIYNSDLKLNNSQKNIFNKAINASKYFMIQGPPGTGKTSYMLAALSKFYFQESEKTILISAYTNRAVEEIYSSIIKEIPESEIIRIGTKTGGDSDSVLLSELSNKMKIRELFDKLKKTRIIISTISSLYTNYELFRLKKFDIAIIDEASQILEPQIIGVISKVEKFILIGDENQLPAVTLQEDFDCKIEDEELNRIGMLNLNNSYFERMITLCKINDWGNSYGTLEEQARMHVEIMEFPNINYYNNNLKAIHSKQFAPQLLFDRKSSSLLEKFLATYRVSFIDCPIELDSKISRSEAIITKRIIELIDQKNKITKSSTIGVISPFKLQCNNIIKEISPSFNELITVDTVERYQGSQREIIIISMAVNSESLLERATSSNALMDIDRKLNVAITRAKEHLIMLGNSDILSKSKDYKKFIEYCKIKNSYIKFEEFII